MAVHPAEPTLPAEDFPHEEAERITELGFVIDDVVRLYPPDDTDGHAELLLLGRYQGNKEKRPYRALVPTRKGEAVIIKPGW